MLETNPYFKYLQFTWIFFAKEHHLHVPQTLDFVDALDGHDWSTKVDDKKNSNLNWVKAWSMIAHVTNVMIICFAAIG
ncbi:25819_t:CDS:2, partial [Gigaspora rosea]